MIDSFLVGQILLLLKRCDTLQKHLQSLHLPSELQSSIHEVAELLRRERKRIVELLEDPDLGVDYLILNQFHDYKRCIEKIDLLESYPLALLDHYNNKDHYLYLFSQHLCEQINYSYVPPLLCAHSNEYFNTLVNANLISMPLAEGDFLLATPDLLHEIGHIFYAKNDRAILNPFARSLRKYIKKKKEQVVDEASSEAYQDYFSSLEAAWLEGYIVEFACDIYAAYIVGPAFAWSHLRLVLTTQQDLYYPSFGEKNVSHPADESRMRAILLTLKELGETEGVSKVLQEWDEFQMVTRDQPDDEYSYCYPDDLLRHLVSTVIEVCKKEKLLSYLEQPSDSHNLPNLMQQAWNRFHQSPLDYAEWETEQIESLKLELRS